MIRSLFVLVSVSWLATACASGDSPVADDAPFERSGAQGSEQGAQGRGAQGKDAARQGAARQTLLDGTAVSVDFVSLPGTMYEEFEYGIRVEYTANADFDMTAEVREGDRIFAIARTSLLASERSGRIPLRVGTLPPPSASAVLTVRAFRPNETESPFYETSRAVVTKAPLRLEGPLHFGGELRGFEDGFTRFYSHHDAATVRVGPCSAPFGPTVPCIESQYSGYGTSETRILNLRTGEIFRDQGNYGTPTSPETLAVPTDPAARDRYIATLLELEARVKHVATPGFGTMALTEYPEMAAPLAYLDGALLSLYRRLGDYLDVQLPPNEPPRLIVGQKHATSIRYGVPEDRDVWVDLFVEGRYVTGSRASVSAGQGGMTTYPGFTIPEGTPPMSRGRIYVKLVPKGGDWREAVAEDAYDVTIHGPEHIAYWSFRSPEGAYSVLPANGRVVVEGAAIARETRDVRVDIFDEAGRWLTGTQVTTEYDQYFHRFSTELAVPASLRVGDRASILVKLLPQGAPWSSYVDQDGRTARVEASRSN